MCSGWVHKKHEDMSYMGLAAVLVVSDSLYSVFSSKKESWYDIDRSGKLAKEFLESKGVDVISLDVVPDEKIQIRKWVLEKVQQGVGFLVLTGGTGFSNRDVTPEALMPILDVEIPGFGEEFRRKSIEKIGVRGMLSRSFAGIIGKTVILALPGSPGGVKDGLELFFPAVGHLNYLRNNS